MGVEAVNCGSQDVPIFGSAKMGLGGACGCSGFVLSILLLVLVVVLMVLDLMQLFPLRCAEGIVTHRFLNRRRPLTSLEVY